MPELTEKDIDYIAKLSRMTLSISERKSLRSDLETIVDYVSSLDALDAELEAKQVEPAFHAFEGASTSLREDEIQPVDMNDPLENAPDVKGHAFVVPKIL